MPDTDDKRELIHQISGTSKIVWLGMDDLEEEGVWRFNDGRVVTQEMEHDIIINERHPNTDANDCVRSSYSNALGKRFIKRVSCTSPKKVYL